MPDELTPSTNIEKFLAKTAGESVELPEPATRIEKYLNKIASEQTITEATDNWLDEHVDPTTGYVLDSTLTMNNAAPPASAVGDLKSAVNDVDDIVFTYTEKQVYEGAEQSGYTTSIFSGWISDFVAERDMDVEKFLIPIMSRSTAITKVRLFFGIGSFFDASTDYVDIDVNIPANTKKIVEFKKKATIAEGSYFYVGYACNQYCDYLYAGTNTYGGSCYKTGGGMPSSSKFGGDSYNVAKKQLELIYVEKGNIIPLSSFPDIPQEKLAFSEFHTPVNLYDWQSESMNLKGYWYYQTTLGTVMTPESNQYTAAYTAITLPIFDADKLYLCRFTPLYYFYYAGFCDKNMRLLSYFLPGNTDKYEVTVPENAVYFIGSFNSSADTNLKGIAISADDINAYSEYEPPYYLLKGCRPEFDSKEEKKTVSLRIPDKYDLVVGDTFQLFFKGIIDAVNDTSYHVQVECLKGNLYKRLFQVTPTESGDITAQVYLFDPLMNRIDGKQITLSTHAIPTSPQTEKTVLCVGDSLTVGGYWVKEFYRRLAGNGGTPAGDNLNNITFIGTLNNDGVGYEGYGGWRFSNYNTASIDNNAKVITCANHDKTQVDQHSVYKDANNAEWKLETIEAGQIKIIAVSGNYVSFPSTGTLTWVSGGANHSDIVYTASANALGNPFWNASESKVDFGWYASNLGVSSIDYVFVLLGWNNAGTGKGTYKQDAQTFITNVHTSFPDAKIVLIGLEIPAQDGLGFNYGASGVYTDYYGLVQYVHDLDDWYEELAEENSNVYHINLSGQFDTEYNMMTITREVNTRNSKTETYQSNGVHPALSGSMQIADAAYRCMAGLL